MAPLAGYGRFVEYAGTVIDGVGVLIIIFGTVVASWNFLRQGKGNWRASYQDYRQDLGRAILLGLEFLVAGDIVRTVAVEPTMDRVLVLGMVVLIRTFLSTSLELELNGKWPWQMRKD